MRRLLLLLALGCSSSPTSTTDAGRFDAGPPDAAPPSGTATLVVNPASEADTGAEKIDEQKIITHHADGTLDSELAADASGTTSVPIERGGALTVATHFSCTGVVGCDHYVLWTVLNVNPGNTLHYGPPPLSRVDVPTTVHLAAFPGAGDYAVDLGDTAGDLGSDPTKPFTASAIEVGRDGLVHVLGWAYDRSGGQALASARGDGTSDVTLRAWVSDPTFTVTLTDPPETGDYFQSVTTVSTTGVRFLLPNQQGPLTDGTTWSVPLDTTGLDSMDVMVNVRSGFSFRNVERRGPFHPSLSLDLAKMLLPQVLTASIDPTSGLHVAWTTDRPFQGDAIEAYIAWTISPSVTADWTIWAPPAATSPLAFPPLPADLDPNYAPPTDASVYKTPTLLLWDTDFTDAETWKIGHDNAIWYVAPGTILESGN